MYFWDCVHRHNIPDSLLLNHSDFSARILDSSYRIVRISVAKKSAKIIGTERYKELTFLLPNEPW